MSAFDKQVGGNHYKDMLIQPIEFIVANGIPYTEGNVIKYVCRWKKKNGLADLEKAKHYIDMLIETEKQRIAEADAKCAAIKAAADAVAQQGAVAAPSVDIRTPWPEFTGTPFTVCSRHLSGFPCKYCAVEKVRASMELQGSSLKPSACNDARYGSDCGCGFTSCTICAKDVG